MNSSLHLSPAENHRFLMSQITPSLRYEAGNVKQWQKRLRCKLQKLVGDLPKERCPLSPRRLWIREHRLGTIEKVVFTSEPFSDVPAYVCLPRNAKPPYTFFICLQGHSTGMHKSIAVKRDDNSRPQRVEGDRDFGLECMRRGVAALCVEQRSFGERRELKQKQVSGRMCQEAAMHALFLGRTLVGERVYDIDRAVDYLATRGDADMKSTGVMGNSGGGTISVFAAALLPRIAFAMPSCYFCTFADSIMSLYHCECNYIPGLFKYAEMSDVMGLFAPKPVVIVAGKQDDIFPVRATRRAFRDLRRIYEAAGAKGHCHLVVGQEGHRFYSDRAWPVMLKEIKTLRKKRPARSGRTKRKYKLRI
ncbi:MAG: alpha/beta hydrolase family protein [Kiritimatiellia bacterium]